VDNRNVEIQFKLQHFFKTQQIWTSNFPR